MSDLFDKLAAQEDAFFFQEFFSPVLRGQKIKVRISGVVVELAVTQPKNYQGWGVFRPTSYKTARFLRDASMADREKYLNLFPAVRLILCRHNENQWTGVPAGQSDSRFKITGLIPVRFAEEVQLFDAVKSRFDGQTFWFQEIDNRHSPRIAEYLREELLKLTDPDKLDCPGLTAGDRDAYVMAYVPALEADLESKKDRQEERIKLALERAGGMYRSYIERGNTFTVEYSVDGHVHRSVVDKETLNVQSAGICLSGHDRDFDLQSLVGVMREGHRRNRVVNTEGRNWNEYGYDPDYQEDDDW
jgi:hypothetical protein